MSKLVNAPLKEVIFEMRWNTTNKQEVDKFQLLIGALYSELKEEYEKPYNLLPDPNIPIHVFLDKPIFRSKNIKDENLLYQVGPGILTINYVGSEYDWSLFNIEVVKIVRSVQELYGFDPQKNIRIALKYLDFFDLSLDNNNILFFLKDKLHINIESDCIQNPIGLNFAVSQKKDNNSILNLRINTGTWNNKRDGLVVESSMQTLQISSDLFKDFDDNLFYFHKELSDFFKSLTREDLYKSFEK